MSTQFFQGAAAAPGAARTLPQVLDRFASWLQANGELSQDHQDFFMGSAGRWAKRAYYRHPVLGMEAVLPMAACEAFYPAARRWFYRKQRHSIADAHFAMGFIQLHHATGLAEHRERALAFLDALERTRCPGFAHHAWGYPFDWETRNGTIPAGTPLITTVPYCYEAFSEMAALDGGSRWRPILRSIADHVLHDYRDVPAPHGGASCTYTPDGGEWVVNASAYRAYMLTRAAHELEDPEYLEPVERNLAYVLASQRADGSWPYATDGVRSFVDHFHTCFVLKALAKIDALNGNKRCEPWIERGVTYYAARLFDRSGLPVPFAERPRLTVYRRELYDYAECINLGILLHGRYPLLDRRTGRTLEEVLERWVQPSGAFRSRKLFLGWDNVPMFRWGQAAMFNSLARWWHLIVQAAGERRPAEAPDAHATR